MMPDNRLPKRKDQIFPDAFVEMVKESGNKLDKPRKDFESSKIDPTNPKTGRDTPPG